MHDLISISQLTKRYRAATIAARAARHHGVPRLILNQALATTPIAALYAIAAAASSLVAAHLVLDRHHMTLRATSSIINTSLGTITIIILAAPWGTCFGWLMRRTMAAIAVLAAWTTFLEPQLLPILPKSIATYMPGNLQMTLVHDHTAIGTLTQLQATSLLFTWLGILTLITTQITRNRDLHA